MASYAARWAIARLRARVKPRLADMASLEQAAESLNAILPVDAGRPGTARVFGSVSGEWMRPREGGASATLLYLHGGAYFAGSPRLYRPIARAFARRGFAVFTPAYRLAPRHPFPAAVEDAKAAYLALAGEIGGPLVVAGDSAGGGLALALMAALRDAGAPPPKAAALFSPWTDLAVTGPSARGDEARDALFTRRMLKIAARNYLAGAGAREPLASPLYADPHGLPPLLLHVGADEILRDDSVRLAERARAAGVATEIELWPGVPHGWQLGADFMPEARQSLERASAFLRRHIMARRRIAYSCNVIRSPADRPETL
jgi:acetyl esterase/lipase